jgi:hypothetical protein
MVKWSMVKSSMQIHAARSCLRCGFKRPASELSASLLLQAGHKFISQL